MGYKTKRSRATNIPQKVKREVYDRDGGRCIFCGRPGEPNAHYIPRSHGGLGIARNIITACARCHDRMDNSIDRPIYLAAAESYLREKYPDWDPDKLIYRKGEP